MIVGEWVRTGQFDQSPFCRGCHSTLVIRRPQTPEWHQFILSVHSPFIFHESVRSQNEKWSAGAIFPWNCSIQKGVEGRTQQEREKDAFCRWRALLGNLRVLKFVTLALFKYIFQLNNTTFNRIMQTVPKKQLIQNPWRTNSVQVEILYLNLKIEIFTFTWIYMFTNLELQIV